MFGPNTDIAIIALADVNDATEQMTQLNKGKPASLVEHVIETGSHKSKAVPRIECHHSVRKSY